MPTSRAFTAICSAPLLCPSRPGLPTSNLRGRPRSCPSARTRRRTASVSPLALADSPATTPVGARYSPKRLRSASAHSPVVTPACAARIETGITFLPDASASSSSRSATVASELLRHVGALHRRHRATHLEHARELLARARDQVVRLLLHDVRAVEQVLVLEQVGLVGEDLLDAQRPLLVPRPRQAERLVPGRQL